MESRERVIRFGEKVTGYAVPVLNEREIRASAGILFLVLFVAFMMVLFNNDFLMVKYVIVVFLTDFFIRVVISPRFSPTLIIGRLIVSGQTPEYVGAAQKKFAWKIGLSLSVLMFLHLVVLNASSVVTLSGCAICLVFLFFESAFGICLGCLFYRCFYKHGPLYCTGDACEPKAKELIQKTSWAQIMVVVGLVIYIFTAIVLFNDNFKVAPRNLREIINRR